MPSRSWPSSACSTRLDAVAIRTYELFYTNRFGQEIWREPRGLDAGYDIPQFSIHRGRLQGVIYQAVRARLGESRIHLNCRLGSFTQDDGGVTAYFFDRNGAHRHTARGDVLIGADGIHSVVRDKLFPNEGPPRWNGLMLWRGAIDWPAFLTGRSMVVAGGLAAKLVIYPIAEGSRPDKRLTNWAVVGRVGDGSTPVPQKQDWSRPGRFEDLMPHVQRFRIPYVDAQALIEATNEFWEYPMCDRDPLPRWSFGRVTLLGDAAHPMYPVGSNGASQAILDARFLADRLKDAEHPGARAMGLRANAAADDGRNRAQQPPRRSGRCHRRRRGARAGRFHQHRRRAVIRASQGHRARLRVQGRLCPRAGQQGRVALTRFLSRRRQEHHFVFGRKRDDFRRRLFLHAVDRPEQIIELAGRRDPEEAFHRLVALVENAVRNLHRQPDEIAGGSDELATVKHEVEPALEHVDELVLRRMDMRRHERAGRQRRVPGERVFRNLLRHVRLAENVPDNAVDTGAGLCDSSGHCSHRTLTP
jgi:2-polyprenyl-6-methoxyphenol hydroxylase-like FAD-dependent oxidoreductase